MPKGTAVKYVMLIHSNPQPWGHPTADYVAEHQALPAEKRAELNNAFDELFAEMEANGEFIGGQALGDPHTARLFRWDGEPVATDGPYAEAKEHLAGFFILDLASRERAEHIGRVSAGPGETIELRPLMGGGGDDD